MQHGKIWKRQRTHTTQKKKKFEDYFLHKKSLTLCVSQHRRKGALQIGTIFHASLQNHQTNKRLHTGRQHTDTDTHTCSYFLACTPKTCTHKAMLIHIPWTVCPEAIKQCIRGSLLWGLSLYNIRTTLFLGIKNSFACQLIIVVANYLNKVLEIIHISHGV